MAVFKPPCSCGHPHSLHDTGWDAAGCMHQSCSCRSYVEANPVKDEIRRLREENERLRWVVRGAHGALTDAETVVVPGVLDGDIAPAIRQLTRERAEARAEAKHLKECNDGHPTMCCGQCASQIKEAKAEVARSHDAILHLTREVERLEGLILDWDGLVGSWQSDMKAEARRIRGEGRDGKA